MMVSAIRWAVGIMTVLCLSTALAEEPQDPREILTKAHEEERSLLKDLQSIDEQLAVLQSEVANMDTKREGILERKTLSEQKLEAARKELKSQEIILAEKIQALYILRKRGVARLIFELKTLLTSEDGPLTSLPSSKQPQRSTKTIKKSTTNTSLHLMVLRQIQTLYKR